MLGSTSPVVPALAALALGLAVGVLTSFLQAVLDFPWLALVNAASPWLTTAFVAGAFQSRLRTACWLGMAATLLQVAGYYVTAELRGYDAGFTYVALWTVCAVVGGPVFGAAGHAGRWDARHLDLIETMDCDVLLLTEVNERVELGGHDLHLGGQAMAAKRRWAAVASRLPMSPLPDPHGASALVELAGLRVCSSVLPWKGCGTREPWIGVNTAERTSAAVADVEARGPEIWGGDWNHALIGREWTGAVAGRQSLLAALERLQLQVPTASSPHHLEGLLSIDHIAVPATWEVGVTERHRAFVGETRISDHDAYVVKVTSALEELSIR
ncbi:endonuclease/exonuclease/phosphatase family protein [Nocardioides sp. cx-169]|uniref:DUF6518 family protein n=1 Tax=Nocardioides sp. cx-169 TaxID=2899080 RepID=UPI001E57603E|nr:DUF6518 family protein [Nocardioides sp. cx-169]MCD4536081.1 endonuclease/exonuclease/phosphatase family protein [Nocardioides sp. cx-169]